MKFFKTVLTIFVAVLLTLFALSVVIKYKPSDSGKESVSESEQYSESKTAEVETGSEKESEKESEKGSEKESESVSSLPESGTKPTRKVKKIVLSETEIIF